MSLKTKSKKNSKVKKLNSTALKESIWGIICRLEDGDITSRAAMAHAREAEALTKVVRNQIRILEADKDGLLDDSELGKSLKDFAE